MHVGKQVVSHKLWFISFNYNKQMLILCPHADHLELNTKITW